MSGLTQRRLRLRLQAIRLCFSAAGKGYYTAARQTMPWWRRRGWLPRRRCRCLLDLPRTVLFCSMGLRSRASGYCRLDLHRKSGPVFIAGVPGRKAGFCCARFRFQHFHFHFLLFIFTIFIFGFKTYKNSSFNFNFWVKTFFIKNTVFVVIIDMVYMRKTTILASIHIKNCRLKEERSGQQSGWWRLMRP